MEEKSGVQISKKAFIQSVIILFVFMMIAGILTRVIPSGSYDRLTETGREFIQPESFQFTPRPNYPVWRWFTAPVEVLWGEDSLLVIVISLFVLMVGGAFAVLDKSGILKAGLGRIVSKYGDQEIYSFAPDLLIFYGPGSFLWDL